MSKKSTGLKEIALAKPITTLLPKTEVNSERIERAAAKIHAPKVTRISIDLTPELYRQLKHDSFDAGMTLKSYVIRMIEIGYQHR